MIDKIKHMWPDWEVIDNLGGGTFGQVYEIHRKIFSHTDKAALKVLSIPKSKSDIQELLYNGYDQKSITERYKTHLEEITKEYALMSELKGCANVVYCDDIRYVQHSDGIGWDIHIKMELLKPIISVLKMPVDEEQVIKIGTDICNALMICKDKNVVHRDIKPQNLFVSDDGTFKLGDFGIAKTAEKTMGGTKTGTYNYMAPEVYNNQPYGAAADQYSLGMVLYWLLNERRMPFFPLPPQIPTASEEEKARQKRMSGEIPPMPKHGSEGLKAVVMRAIAPNPKDRFPSAQEMKKALLSYGIEEKNEKDEKEAMSLDFSFEDESIEIAESTMGNSWFFDEGSVGPGVKFSKDLHNFEAEKTVGLKWEEDKRKDAEEIKYKKENKEGSKDHGLVIYRIQSAKIFQKDLVEGCTYLFYVDKGNTWECCFNEVKITCDDGKQSGAFIIKRGRHTVSVRVYGPNDPKCKGTPIFIHPPVSFEVKGEASVIIEASRPTKEENLSVDVIYEPYKSSEEKSTQEKQNKEQKTCHNNEEIKKSETAQKQEEKTDFNRSDFLKHFEDIFGGDTGDMTATLEVTPSERIHGFTREVLMNIDGEKEIVKVSLEKSTARTTKKLLVKGKGCKKPDGSRGNIIFNLLDVPEKKLGKVEYHVLNDNLSPLALANGSTYVFTHKSQSIYLPIVTKTSVISKRTKQIEVEMTEEGRGHKVELKVYGWNDPTCSKDFYTCAPITFDVKPGYTTIIKANRPSPLHKLKMSVEYRKN